MLVDSLTAWRGLDEDMRTFWGSSHRELKSCKRSRSQYLLVNVKMVREHYPRMGSLDYKNQTLPQIERFRKSIASTHIGTNCDHNGTYRK